MSRVIQAIIDEAMKLESDLTTANECLDDVIAQREECKQQLALTIGDLHDLQRELEKPQQNLQQYLDQIHNLNKENKQQRLEIGRLNDKINTSPARGPWDNRMVLLPGYGTVLASHLYEQGWPEAAISGLVCPPPDTVPTYSEWYRTYGQPIPFSVPPMPGLPSAPPVVLSDDQSHWVAVPDIADEVAEVPESLQSFRQRNRAKPTHDE